MSTWQELHDWARRLFNPRFYRYRPPPESPPGVMEVYHTLFPYHIATPQELTAVLRRGRLQPDFRYRHFTAPKADGSPRELAEPDSRLKELQQRTLRYVLNRQNPHPAAVGFRKRRSIADHVWAHAGAPYIITADIPDFFPATRARRIDAWWGTQCEHEDAARLMALLTTYRGGLPQGAPTSPALSNLVNAELDEALDRRARHLNGAYTRYGDDMAFSFYDRPPADFIPAVRAALRAVGYESHRWGEYGRNDEPVITGVRLRRDGTVVITDEMRAAMKRLRRSRNPEDETRWRGYEGFRLMVERPPARRR